MTTPILAIIGYKETGKTTLIEDLTKEFSSRGYKVGAVKHIPHPDFTIDTPNTDTWRYAQANAKVVVAVSPSEIAVIRRVPEADISLDTALKFIVPNEVDLIIIEGFKQQTKDRTDIPKIIVLNAKAEVSFLESYVNIIMAIADDPLKKYNAKIPFFTLKEIEKIADIIEATFPEMKAK